MRESVGSAALEGAREVAALEAKGRMAAASAKLLSLPLGKHVGARAIAGRQRRIDCIGVYGLFDADIEPSAHWGWPVFRDFLRNFGPFSMIFFPRNLALFTCALRNFRDFFLTTRAQRKFRRNIVKFRENFEFRKLS